MTPALAVSVIHEYQPQSFLTRSTVIPQVDHRHHSSAVRRPFHHRISPYLAFFPRPPRLLGHTLNSLLLYSVGNSPCPKLVLPRSPLTPQRPARRPHCPRRTTRQNVSPAKYVHDVSSSQRNMNCNLSHKDCTTIANTGTPQSLDNHCSLLRIPHCPTFTLSRHARSLPGWSVDITTRMK